MQAARDFICEKNLYACSTSVEASTAVTNIADRAAGYAIPGVVVDGQDVLAVHDAVSAAVYRARSGQGPTLIEAKTYRYRDHAVNMGKMSDIDIGSRSVEEVEHWQLRDPIPLFRKVLVDDFGVSSATLDTIESKAREDAAESLRFAQESAFPEPAEAFEDVFVSAKG